MNAVTSALAGGMITPAEAATIVAELAVPDLDLIKQDEQGCGAGVSGSPRDGRTIPPAGRATAATTSTALPGYFLPGKGNRAHWQLHGIG